MIFRRTWTRVRDAESHSSRVHAAEHPAPEHPSRTQGDPIPGVATTAAS